MGEAVLDEEIEGAIDRNRGGAVALGAEPVDDVIGGGGNMALEQRRQHFLAPLGEAQALGIADLAGMADGVRGAATVVVLAMFQYRADVCHCAFVSGRLSDPACRSL